MTKSYDPTKLAILVGPAALKSWNSASPSKDEEKWTHTSGTTGEDTRSKNANDLGMLSIKMPMSSDDNDKMSVAYEAGSTLKITLKDNNGRSLFIMPTGTVSHVPQPEYTVESGENEWIIRGKWSLFFVGGNI